MIVGFPGETGPDFEATLSLAGAKTARSGTDVAQSSPANRAIESNRTLDIEDPYGRIFRRDEKEFGELYTRLKQELSSLPAPLAAPFVEHLSELTGF